MRVAIYHNLPPGGALRVLSEFVRRSRTEHEYDLYTVDLGPADDFAYAADRGEQHDLAPHVSRWYRYPVVSELGSRLVAGRPWRVAGPQLIGRVERQIALDIDRRRYDVVLVHPCQVTHTPSLLRHLRVPSLHYMHEPRRRSFEAGYQPVAPGASLPRRGAAWMLEGAFRRRDRAAALAADRIACNSYYTAEAILRAYGRDASVCYPGVDGDVFGLAPTEPGTTPAPAVISVGGLEEVKGHDLVVRALGLLPPDERPALDLVYERCDNAYRRQLEMLAASTGVELRLHSGIADADLARLYRSAAATVVTARLEPFGLVPLESLACGTPVVALREAGYRETVEDGVNGYLVDRSPAEIASAVRRALSNGLGRSARDLRATVIPRWGWDGAVKRQLEVLAATAEEARR